MFQHSVLNFLCVILLCGLLNTSSAGLRTASSLSSTIVLRGGFLDRNISPSYDKEEIVDRIAEATSLLNNMKVPAALIAGQSLSAAFTKFDYKNNYCAKNSRNRHPNFIELFF